jgi:hypothetical protein
MKLDVYKINEADVLVFYERVQEALRIAEHELKNLITKKQGTIKGFEGADSKSRKKMNRRLKYDV